MIGSGGVKKGFIRELGRIAGSEHVSTAAEDLLCYGYDGSPGTALPDVVIHPASTEEVAAIVLASAHIGLPVVARGAGTGLSGGSLPVRGGLVVSFDRMAAIRELDPDEMLAIVEPGTVNWTLAQAAAAAGLYYPPDPSSTKVCTLGGNVAENAGGPHAVKYGVTGDYVIGLEGVLASGRVIRTGGRTRRNVTGYDLTSLLVGSEGTLAIITGITVRLVPRPRARQLALIGFEGLASAGESIVAISREGITPAACEIMDRTTMDCVERYRKGSFPDGAAATILIELDGESESVDSQLYRTAAICEAHGGSVESLSSSEAGSESLWEARRSISAALGQAVPTKIGEDVSVPRTRVPEMLARLQQVASRHDLPIAVFGHAADGNLHPNLLTDSNDHALMKRTQAAIADIFEAALELGGTLTGEHGVGTAKAPFMKEALPAETIEMMKEVKRAFDPRGLLNPGKIFPEEAPG